MPKIEKEFKNFYKLSIVENKLRVSWHPEPNENYTWSFDKIFEKDFKIEANQFGENAGILKIEIGD